MSQPEPNPFRGGRRYPCGQFHPLGLKWGSLAEERFQFLDVDVPREPSIHFGGGGEVSKPGELFADDLDDDVPGVQVGINKMNIKAGAAFGQNFSFAVENGPAEGLEGSQLGAFSPDLVFLVSGRVQLEGPESPADGKGWKNDCKHQKFQSSPRQDALPLMMP